MDEKDSFQLTQKGLLMMLKVLVKAENLGLIDPSSVSDDNIKEYIRILADNEEIWEGSLVEERTQKVVLAAMILLKIMEPPKTEKQLN